MEVEAFEGTNAQNNLFSNQSHSKNKNPQNIMETYELATSKPPSNTSRIVLNRRFNSLDKNENQVTSARIYNNNSHNLQKESSYDARNATQTGQPQTQ